MGKASSSKKVARAARAGGRSSSGQPRSFLFPSVVTLTVVLGLALVVFARSERQSEDQGGVPQLGDHIHQAISVNACGEFKPNLPGFESTIGIHTHEDGVIHIHPHSQLGAGANATLGRYLKNVQDEGGLDFSLSSTKLTYQGETFEEGETTCEGVDDPELRVAYWADVSDPTSTPTVTTGGFGDLRLTEDGAGITIYFGDPGADIPRPPHADQLAALGAADGGQVSDPEGNTTTTAPEGAGEPDEGDADEGDADEGDADEADSGDETTTTAP
jgi:hypothetical protein